MAEGDFPKDDGDVLFSTEHNIARREAFIGADNLLGFHTSDGTVTNAEAKLINAQATYTGRPSGAGNAMLTEGSEFHMAEVFDDLNVSPISTDNWETGTNGANASVAQLSSDSIDSHMRIRSRSDITPIHTGFAYSSGIDFKTFAGDSVAVVDFEAAGEPDHFVQISDGSTDIEIGSNNVFPAFGTRQVFKIQFDRSGQFAHIYANASGTTPAGSFDISSLSKWFVRFQSTNENAGGAGTATDSNVYNFGFMTAGSSATSIVSFNIVSGAGYGLFQSSGNGPFETGSVVQRLSFNSGTDFVPFQQRPLLTVGSTTGSDVEFEAVFTFDNPIVATASVDVPTWRFFRGLYNDLVSGTLPSN